MKLYRYKKCSRGVLGILKDDVGGSYFTAENAEKAIPEGLYKVSLTFSPRFKRNLPLLTNPSVSAERGIRIHEGNVPNRDSSGCVLVGNGCDLSSCNITNSKPALGQLLKCLGESLEIVDLTK